MSLKQYKELTEKEKKLVTVMFSDQTTVEQYLYNFDNDGKYLGRQYAPEGSVYNEPLVEEEIKEEKPKQRRGRK